MFETLFKYPRVLARHREAPVADARERFLTHCAEQGLARESLLRTAREILIIAKHIEKVNVATRQWRERFPTPPSPPLPALQLKLVCVIERILDQPQL